MNLLNLIIVKSGNMLCIFLILCIFNACTNAGKNSDKDLAFTKLMHSATENGYLVDSTTLWYKSSDGNTSAFGEVAIKEDLCDTSTLRKGIGIAYGYISLKDNRLIKQGYYLLKFSLNGKKDVSAVFLENLNKEKILTFSDWKISDGKETTTVSKASSANFSFSLGNGVSVKVSLYSDTVGSLSCFNITITVSGVDSNGKYKSVTKSTQVCEEA